MKISHSFSEIIIVILLSSIWEELHAERCQYVLQNNEGVIKSPNHPQNYPNNIVCTWRIEAQDGYNILLQVKSFRLDGTYPDCKQDALLIYDGRNDTADSFQSPYCGTEMISSLKSTGNFLFLKFITDSLQTFPGFKIEYKAEQNCNGTFKADNGTILSPRYPEDYYSNANCYWMITTNVGTTVNVKFQDFHLEGREEGVDQCYDYLAFYDVLPKKTKEIGLYCGNKLPSEIRSQTNVMRIHFFSDGTVTRKGFNLTFSAQYFSSQNSTISTDKQKSTSAPITGVCNNRSQFKCSNEICIPIEKRCNQHSDCEDHSDELNCADKCDVQNGGCEHKCNVHPVWKEFCSCEAGYELADDKLSCQDINECASRNGGCGEMCSNFAGGYKCECSGSGYQIGPDGKTCQDIDECRASPCQHGCVNTVGSYRCTCSEGFRATRTGHCVDQDECAFGVPSCFDCINTIGSYRCNCYTGFIGVSNASKCEDVNECLDGTHKCSHNCVNTYGSYQCHCKDGFTKQGNRCIDVDECQEEGWKCEHLCENMPGTFRCNCRPGFMLINETRCIDMSECKTRYLCEHGCTIVNSSYVCTCPNGYFLGFNGRNCFQELMHFSDCGRMSSLSSAKKYEFSKADRYSLPWKASVEVILPPFNIAIRLRGCMATLVSRVFLLTTAHCVYFEKERLEPKLLRLRFPDSFLSNATYEVQEIWVHPDFDKPNMRRRNDIAVIKLSKPISTDSPVQPICIDRKRSLEVGDSGFLIQRGWMNKARLSSKLQEIRVTKQSITNCAWLANIGYDLTQMSCIGSFSSTTPCLVDSGTPLMVQDDERWFLVGMMVHGAGLIREKACYNEYRNIAFYDLSYLQKWIYQ